jgi:hypothetical protein
VQAWAAAASSGAAALVCGTATLSVATAITASATCANHLNMDAAKARRRCNDRGDRLNTFRFAIVPPFVNFLDGLKSVMSWDDTPARHLYLHFIVCFLVFALSGEETTAMRQFAVEVTA